jgi:hypothetical protein
LEDISKKKKRPGLSVLGWFFAIGVAVVTVIVGAFYGRAARNLVLIGIVLIPIGILVFSALQKFLASRKQ